MVMGLMSFGLLLMELALKFQLQSQITVSYFPNCNASLLDNLLGISISLSIGLRLLLFSTFLISRYTHLCCFMMQHGPKIMTLHFWLCLLLDRLKFYREQIQLLLKISSPSTVKLEQNPLVPSTSSASRGLI